MKPPRQPLYEMRIAVRWGDMDALGHVNNTLYFRYFEQVRIEWLERLGYATLPAEDPAQPSEGPVIADAHCQFLIPVTYPAELLLQMSGGPPGRSSFDIHYELRDAADAARLYSTGSTRLVWVDYRAGRSTPLPAVLREQLPTAAGDS